MGITVGIDIGMKMNQAKSQFFDRFLIQSPLEKAEHKFLNRAGASVRLTARRNIKKRKTTSKPGQNPTDQTRVLREGIVYIKDPVAGSVIIGPALINRKHDRDTLEILEHGGVRRVRHGYFYTPRGSGKTAKKVYVPKGRRQVYEPRSFMGPALEKIAPRLPEFWDRAIN